jgi:hypothetical protein
MKNKTEYGNNQYLIDTNMEFGLKMLFCSIASFILVFVSQFLEFENIGERIWFVLIPFIFGIFFSIVFVRVMEEIKQIKRNK